MYTIGYGSGTVEDLLARLQRHEIQILLDVRSSPYSGYKPEFNREALRERVGASGIVYRWVGQTLGGRPERASCYTSDGRVDYSLCAIDPTFASGFEKLREIAQKGYRACLMCSEGKAETCHRTKLLADALIDRYGVEVLHIAPSGELETHLEVMSRVKGNPVLSAKSYR